MERFDINIIHRYFSGLATQEESEQLLSWIETSEENKVYLERLKWIWDQSTIESKNQLEEYNPDTKAALTKLNESISRESKTAVKPLYKKLSWVGIAASLLLILGIWQGNSMFTKNETVTYSTLSGETKELILPDSSKVWLAENSELSFAQDRKKRRTTLKGEGYFEISKDKKRPFTIKGNETGITVLGTQFNYISKSDESEELVHVMEGKVKYYALENRDKSLTLTPGEYGSYEKKTSSLLENKSKNRNISSWATGLLVFEDTKLEKAISDIEEYYKVSIRVESALMTNCSLTTKFDREELNTVLETIAVIYQAEMVKHDDSNYSFRNGSCK